MLDGKALSAAIRKRKMGSLKPDMDYAGQEAVDPNTALDEKMNTEISEILDEPDHEPATKEEMGEHESSQEILSLKRAMAKISKYFEHL